MLRSNASLRQQFRALLSVGDRRSIVGVAEVLAIVQRYPKSISSLTALLWDSGELVRMRAADALEKLSRQQAALLQPLKPALLQLLTEINQKEVRWHLAVVLPRLSLTRSERSHVADTLQGYLKDRSSIVKAFALQGLADLALQDPELIPTVVDIVRASSKTGTPAMKARARKLLRVFE